MTYLKNFTLLILVIVSIIFWSCKKDTKWKGQYLIKKVSTHTRPIQYQLQKTYSLGNGIYCSNEFAGALLKVLHYTIENMQYKHGYFYFRQKKGITTKIPNMP